MHQEMVIFTDPTTGNHAEVMSKELFREQDEQRVKAKGYVIEVVSYEEYQRRSEALSAFAAEAHMHRQLQMGFVSLVGIEVDLQQISDTGLPVRYRLGECSGEQITWCDPAYGLLVHDPSCNPDGDPGVNVLDSIDDEGGWGYAGWEAATKTWWRYKGEAQGGYREHCMQILSLTAVEVG